MVKPKYCEDCKYSNFNVMIKDRHSRFMINKMGYGGKCIKLGIYIKKDSKGCDRGELK